MKKLTAQSRGIVYLSLFVSGLVIASALLYFFTARRGGGANTQTAGVVIGLIALAILACGYVIYIRARRTRYTRALNPDYYGVYEQVSDILQGSALGMLERKEVSYDILGLLLQAQQDGRPVADVVGKDVEAFMQKVQSSFGYRNRSLCHLMNGIQYGIAYLFLLQAVLFFEEAGRISFFEAMPDISMVALMGVTAFLAIPLIRYYVRRQKAAMAALIPIGLIVVFIGAMELSRAYLYHVSWIRTFLDGQVALIPSFGIMLLWAALAAAAQAMKWLQRRISITRLGIE